MKDEYTTLRQEMNMYYQNVAHYNSVLYSASNAILLFALTQKGFYYCLIPLMVIIPLYLLVENEHKKACWLGAYLNVFCEGTIFNWERRHHCYDRTFGSRKRDIKEILPYLVLSIVSCLFSAIKVVINSDLNKWFLAIPVLCLLISYAIIIKAAVNYSELRNDFISEWKNLKMYSKER